MATSGKDWRRQREEGVEIQLPSGLTARLRGLGAATLLHSGIVPDYLTDALVKRCIGMQVEDPPAPDTDAVRAKLVYLDEIARRMFVSPRIVNKSVSELADDEITIDDVEDVDKLFLPGLVGTPTAFLSDFLRGQAANLADVLFKQGLSLSAQSSAEPAAGTATGTAEPAPNPD